MSDIAPYTSQPWPRPLLTILERQLAVVAELATLSHSQPTLIAQNHTDGLLQLLTKRQTLIDEFTASQGSLDELTRDLDKRLETVETADRDRVKSLIHQIGEHLSLVMRRDEEDQAALKSARNQIKTELASLGTAKHARNAYAGATSASTRFEDRRV